MQSWQWGTNHPDKFLSSKDCGEWNCHQPNDVVALGEKITNYNGRYQPTEKSTEIGKIIDKPSGILYVTARC